MVTDLNLELPNTHHYSPDVGNTFRINRWQAGLAILLFSVTMASARSEWSKAIQFDPPLHFDAFKLSGGPEASPFSGNGPGFMLLSTDQSGQINFQVGAIGWSIGNGYAITYYKIGPDELVEELATENGEPRLTGQPRSKGKRLTGVRKTTVGGLSAARWTGQVPVLSDAPVDKAWVEALWIQVDTNLALKITASAQTQETFTAITNSLATLRIDVQALLKGLEPKEPTKTETQLNTIELGYMQWRGKRTAAGILRTRGQFQSFAIGHGIDGPEGALADARSMVESFNQKKNQPGALRLALVSHSRIGDRPNDFQRNFWLIHETNQNKIAEFRGKEFEMAPPDLTMWECWTNRVPEQFQKVAAYPLGVKMLTKADE